MASSAYLNVRNAIADGGSDARVEVNQRALIDKILARYASAGAVYRELLQNSNDAEATTAEIIITTSSSDGDKVVVSQVIYRNNGLPFRAEDWSRLRKIAEGNPDASKVGAFGVGAYTMFSICEEPLVVSGEKGQEEAMAFFWKGDSLWTKTGKAPDGILNMSASLDDSVQNDSSSWTSFILPSRDPYSLPDFVEFGRFLTASLTFTQCLTNIRVFVNGTLQLNIRKTTIESHTIVTPKASSWWKNDGAVTSSSSGMFTLGKGADLTQTSIQMSVSLRKDLSPNSGMETSEVRARFASAMVKTKIPIDIEKRMIRVTKKKPPKELTVQIFLDAADHSDDDQQQSSSSNLKKKPKQSKADLITQSFAPTLGSGRIFIGFRTSQTTGLGIHLAAPLMPTVEREAIDFIDPALREFNSELLEVSGILMRLALEHEMMRLGIMWENGKEGRAAWESQREERKNQRQKVEEEEKKSETDDAGSAKDSADDKSSISSSLFSFASFMARGVKNSVIEAIKVVPDLLGEDNETTELLNPIDDRPLSIEERDAIILMKAYCPRQSTPDSLVGQCLAKGFGRCMTSSSPPVLTVDGVSRGIDSRLPNHGMESFYVPNAVRRILLENAKEYHTVIANCPTMNVDDLTKAMNENVLSKEMLVRLLKWYPKYARISNPTRDKSLRLKEAIKYHADPKVEQSSDADTTVCKLDSIFYFAPRNMNKQLPLPETVFPHSLTASIGMRALEDRHFSDWFKAMPFDIWTAFIAEHPCMRNGDEKEDDVRIMAWSTLSKHFDSLETASAKRQFIALLPLTSPCLPFDSASDTTLSAPNARTAVPNELYLPDTDLSAFSGVGTFYKVSKRLTKEGVSDQFLLALGVRKTIKIDLLFLNLDTLNWNSNPRPLIEFLINAELSHQDLQKLRSTKYLPSENDKAEVFAPSQLYLKDNELSIFPFVMFLQWPSNEGMSTADRNFLLKLGVRVEPPLTDIIGYLQKEAAKNVDSRDDIAMSKALQYLTQRLGPKGTYFNEFHQTKVNFLPCIRQNLETNEIIKEIKSPSTCYFNPTALVLGFSTLDPIIFEDCELMGVRLKCQRDPSPQVMLRRLLQLVDISKGKLDQLERQGIDGIKAKEKVIEKTLVLFDGVFLYLSSRTGDFQKKHLSELATKTFIPCKCRSGLQFYSADQVFFRKRGSDGDRGNDSIVDLLFKQVEYNAFLSFAGVKIEPSLEELFDLMLQKPDEVLDSIGEPKYKALLCRIAANPPYKRVTPEIKSTPFLLGYLIVDNDEPEGDEMKSPSKAQYLLAKAEDIYIVDNSFLRRQFPMLIGPMEQNLEELYRSIGSKYVSEVIHKDFEVLGKTHRDTPLTRSFAERIKERRPLLLSPTITSRPLVSNAAAILDDLEFFQAESIRAIYSFERSSKVINVTCCSKLTKRKNRAIFITKNFEMFDIGSCIGDLILQHCELKDAFFLTSLLEASIGTLRNRGFPVDRIVKPNPTPVAEAKMEPRDQTHDNNSSRRSPEKPLHPSSNGKTNDGSMDAAKDPTPGRDNHKESGFDTILQSMFPQYSQSEISDLLGPNPTKEKAAEVANQLSEKLPNGIAGSNLDENEVLINDAACEPNNLKKEKKSSRKFGMFADKIQGLGSMPQKLNKRLGGSGNQGVSRGVIVGQGQGDDVESKGREDAAQRSLEAMLQQSVQSSRSVNSTGVTSQETLLQNLPEGIDCRNDGCEVVPAQNIRPFKGPYGNHKSRNGIRLMVASRSASAANEAFNFISDNFECVDKFAVVIGHLVQIFQLNISSVAIYYDGGGNTIAFNSHKAFHFNLRFFHALHRHEWNSRGCYSYWFTVFCHELAHNLVSAHNKEHGKYTESIITLYLPSFVDFLSRSGIM